jgi:hypothetical protein
MFVFSIKKIGGHIFIKEGTKQKELFLGEKKKKRAQLNKSSHYYEGK